MVPRKIGTPTLADMSIARLPVDIPRGIITRDTDITNPGKITKPKAARHVQVGMNMDVSRARGMIARGEMNTNMSLGRTIYQPAVGDGKNTASIIPDSVTRMVKIGPSMEGTVDTRHRIASPLAVAPLMVMVVRKTSMGDMEGVNREQLPPEILI